MSVRWQRGTKPFEYTPVGNEIPDIPDELCPIPASADFLLFFLHLRIHRGQRRLNIFFFCKGIRGTGKCPAVPNKHLVFIAYNNNYSSLSMMEGDQRFQLNEFMQRRYGGTRRIEWDAKVRGPQNQPIWEVKAYLDGYEVGRGEGPSRAAAKEVAAAQALAYLRSHEG
ncbi:hypothetical protein F5J12DRAFT_35642 [Pisolithus orientalis]|uniref:uncharacterized protein n=1 Tax=Pisolithus orientalis TaxID=936130 RepID=UPI0022240603|nr:uncharacterized protein F5J12DRAFT_35642 [Pisolithus orientalis]KAI6035657.1 hypothetical protein F5J12DRAFT_35642 [Pisolithus orientalis]